tara:strand:- start:464 stop:649 length:186 start_codon:yes stop_codon:yes gene_type:complete
MGENYVVVHDAYFIIFLVADPRVRIINSLVNACLLQLRLNGHKITPVFLPESTNDVDFFIA